MSRQALRDLAAGVSLANLCFIGGWDEVLQVNRNSYLRDVSAASVVAVMLDVLLLGVACAGAVTLARRSGSAPALWTTKAAFLLVVLLPLMQIFPDLHVMKVIRFVFRALETPDHQIRGSDLNPLFPLLAIALWPARSVKVTRTVVAFLLPLTLVTFGRAGWRLGTGNVTAANADRPLAPPVPRPPRAAPRVVILLFDEMDFRLAYSARPAGIALPELDRLRAEAFFASQAFPPGRRTEVSVPALLSGRPVTWDRRRGTDTLLVTFAGTSDTVSWADQPNVFDRARALGYNPGVVGWYHPYCRLFTHRLTRCFWLPHKGAIFRARARGGLPQQMLDLFWSLNPLGDRGRHIADHQGLLAEARTAVADTSLGLVFVHLAVPHYPPIYDREDEELTAFNYHINGYYDNLVLADRTLGVLRRTLEEAGLWDRSTVVLTSDHSRRAGEDDWRVPFVVKLAGQHTGGPPPPYRAPFNTVALHDLTLALLRGEVSGGVARWLDGWRAANHHSIDTGSRSTVTFR
ncbi:MAG: sulfatase-like hydrolase/transferase [Gemmatimonadales bacterium]